MNCCICKGSAHPASGAQYTATAIACGPCVREFWQWIIRRQKGKPRGGGPSFYDHVAPIEVTNAVAPAI